MKTVLHAVAEHAQKNPCKLAVISQEQSLNYSELWNSALNFSIYLKENGIRKTDRVVVAGVHSAIFAVICLGTHLAGGIFVPVDKGTTAENFKSIVDSTDARFSFDRENIFRIPINTTATTAGYDMPKLHDYADILFTTGTTGKPEGIIHSFASHYATVENLLSVLKLKDDHVCMITAPINHSFALRRFYMNLVHGGAIVFLDNVLPVERFFTMLENHNVNAITMPPSVLPILLKAGRRRLPDFADRLQYLQFASAPLKRDIVEEVVKLLPHTGIYNVYGSTESGCVAGFNYAEHLDKVNCIGKSTQNATLVIVGADGNFISGNGPENKGLLAVSGPMNMEGYWDSVSHSVDRRHTAEIVRDGYVYTQDLVYRDDDGFIYFISRVSDIINTGGLKIVPGEVEDVAKSHHEVVDCACVGRKDNIAGEVAVLVVVPKSAEFEIQDLYVYLKQHLEQFKIPKEILIAEELPKTYNGKLNRRELRDWLNGEYNA